MTCGKILYAKQDGTYVLKFVGDVRLPICQPLSILSSEDIHNMHLEKMLVDVTDAEGIDSTALGLLAKIALGVQKECGCKPTIYCKNDNIYRVLSIMGFDKICVILDDAISVDYPLEEFNLESSELDMHKYSLDAHKILMTLNDDNKLRFHEVVKTLEYELVLYNQDVNGEEPPKAP